MFRSLALAAAVATAITASTVALAADPKLVLPAIAPTAAPTVTAIAGTPLTINVGSDHTFQIRNSAIPGTGQIYPSGATATADMGWFVRIGATKFAPDFSQHPGGTATGSIGTNTAWTPGTLGALTGTGTSASPFKVTVNNALPGTTLNSSQEINYVNGENFFRKKFTLSNSGASAITATVFLGADIYLAASDSGIPQRISGSPGGKDCGAGTYNILMIPQGALAPVAYSATGYSTVWAEIGAGTLSNTVGTTCVDNGSALQWSVTIPAGGSNSVEAATSFGAIPTAIVTPPVEVVVGPSIGVPTMGTIALALLILGMIGIGAGLGRSRRRRD